MKPAQFRYVRAGTTAEAVELLAEHGDDAKVLAGGQSLVPMLNFRLARPAVLVDIGTIGELTFLRRSQGELCVGAATKQATVESSSLVAREWPLLSAAMGWIAHPQIRNAGTIGGSLAHADPAAELPAVCVTLDAHMRLSSVRGQRTVPALEFFESHFTSVMEADELLTEVVIPAPKPNTGWGFCEFARRRRDFALCGAAALLRLDDDGHCADAALTLMTVAPTPWRAREVEATLVGRRLDGATLAQAASLVAAQVSPTGDIFGSSRYRARLAGEMAERALVAASVMAETLRVGRGA